jgi:hypothetical protein
VERGIEARDLRQFQINAHRHFDGREIEGLVQWRERHQLFQFGEQLRRHVGRARVMHPAMHDAVADRGEPPIAQPFSGPRHDRRERLARHCRRFRPQWWRCDLFAVGPGSLCRWVCTDPIDLPGQKPRLALIEAEFDR